MLRSTTPSASNASANLIAQHVTDTYIQENTDTITGVYFLPCYTALYVQVGNLVPLGRLGSGTGTNFKKKRTTKNALGCKKQKKIREKINYYGGPHEIGPTVTQNPIYFPFFTNNIWSY